MNNHAVFVSARSSSTRLPNKVLLDINGSTALDHLVKNLKQSNLTDTIVICTTTNPADDEIEKKAVQLNVKCFRGSEKDKLARWKGACKKFNIEMFAECGADDLLCDHELIDSVFRTYYKSGCDFINGKDFYNDVYGITYELLRNIYHTLPKGIEAHDLSFAIKESKFSTCRLNADKKFQKKYRLTLDYPEDLIFFKELFKKTGKHQPSFDDIIKTLDNNPNIVDINFFLEKEWIKNQDDQILRQ